MFGFDLQSGYHHVEIFEEHQTYLGFAWTDNEMTETYGFRVLPFGLATAGHIFTKICRVMVKYWRCNGVQIVLYIDDGLGVAHTQELCERNARCIKGSLEKAGWVINEEKSRWDPSKRTTWLG